MFSIQPDGTHPMPGDNDNARAIYFGERRPGDFRDLLALGAVLFQRSDMKKMAGEFAESCLWLLGPESHQKFSLLNTSAPAARSKFFRESGYAILRTGWNHEDHYLIFGCGPQNNGSHRSKNLSVAHGHEDFPGFTLNVFGVPLLVDAGIFADNGYFEETKAEQAFYNCQADFAFVEGSYSGFGCNLRHRRGIFWRKGDYWLILDALSGTGEHLIERWFHFVPAVNLQMSGRQVITQRRDHKNILLQDLGPHESTPELFEGGERPEQAWLANGCGGKTPAPVLCLRRFGLVPTHLCTLILPFEAQPPEIESQQSGHYGAESQIPFFFRLRTARWEDRIVFNFTGRLQKIDDLCTDARMTYVRHELASRLAFATVAQGTRLELNGNRLLSSDRAVDAKFSSIALNETER
jgi:hypothetical protein